MKTSRGFTLIELMIVVAIIGILATIAISAYSISVAKAELSEAFVSAEGLKTDVLTYYRESGSCPSNGASGISAAASYSGKYVASSTVGSGAAGCTITVQLRNGTVTPPLRGTTVVFTMTNSTTAASIPWNCSSTASLVYLPRACR